MLQLYFVYEIKHKHVLKASEKRIFVKRLIETFNINVGEIIGGRMEVEVADLREKKSLIIINGRPLFIDSEGDLTPTLLFEEIIGSLPKVFVDMGAIPHICNGADIMAPGIVRVDGEFKEGDLITVLDEKHGKAIAIARSLVNSEVIRNLKRGKVLKNIHYVGDSIWKIIFKSSSGKQKG
ncbi:MAG: DUF1947 domain-containing protein [Candidatus Bathyarchaeia archaeon]